MKTLTLWQPWASLVALGVKTIETRSWSTSYRGPLAIHAAKKRPGHGEIGDYVYDDCRSDDGWIAPIHSRDGYTNEPVADWIGDHLPLGAVVAICTLVDVVPMTESGHYRPGDEDYMEPHLLLNGLDSKMWLWDGDAHDVEDQRPYGDFSPGRYAWLLADNEPLAEPIPARGRQQLWEWTPDPAQVSR